MDAQDTRTAQERIDQAEGRLAALQEQGIDTAGLNSQLAFARAALASGQTLDVMAMCEEVLIAAKRLLAQPPVAASRPVKTDRIPKPSERVPSGLYPSLGSADETRDRQRLTEEIRQAVHSDLMPKALSATQLNERIRTTVERTLDERLQGLHDKLSRTLDERFQRLAAEPSTAAFAKPPSAEEIAALLSSTIDERFQRLAAEPSTAAFAKPPSAEEVAAVMSSAIDERLSTLLSQRLETSVPACVHAAVQTAVQGVVQGLVQTAVHDAVEATVQPSIQAAVQIAVHDAMASVTEAVAAPIRELVAEALHQASAVSAPPDLEALATRLGNDLRSDMDWQVERLAAEKGWVTLADVHAELRANVGTTTPSDANHVPGFARLEAALVEFVRQTQSQQAQFLSVLQERVDQGTAVVVQNLARAIAGDKNRSSAVFRQGTKSLSGDRDAASLARGADPLATESRATDARGNSDQSALVSHTLTGPSGRPDATRDEGELDALTMTAQHRAIGALDAPMGSPSSPVLPRNTSSVLPGTRVTGRITAASAEASATADSATVDSAEEHSSAARPSTMMVENRTALNVTNRPTMSADSRVNSEPSQAVDPSSITLYDDTRTLDLGTEAIEMTPLNAETGESSGLVARRSSQTLPTESRTGTATRILSAAIPAASGTTKSAPPTTRVAAFETGLRNLVKGEVERQIGATPAATVTTRRIAAADLDERIHLAVAQALKKHLEQTFAERPTSTAEVRLTVPCDNDLRAAITRSMPDMLQDPGIRQQILGVVAVEAVANPGALAELTGIRAFIRAEVRHAHVNTTPADDAAQTTAHVDHAQPRAFVA